MASHLVSVRDSTPFPVGPAMLGCTLSTYDESALPNIDTHSFDARLCQRKFVLMERFAEASR